MSGTPKENGQSIQKKKDAEREAQMDNEPIKKMFEFTSNWSKMQS